MTTRGGHNATRNRDVSAGLRTGIVTGLSIRTTAADTSTVAASGGIHSTACDGDATVGTHSVRTPCAATATDACANAVRLCRNGSAVNQNHTGTLIRTAANTGAAAPAVPVKDTIKVADKDGKVVTTPDRATLYAVQTPQCFDRALYLQALEAVSGEKASLVTDDCSLFELAGLPVTLTAGDYANLKITTKEDLQKENTMRIGHGYDVHRLVEDRKLILGGVEVPYEKGLLGHSDADVLLHAVMDAVLGAAALGDIGQHFPDTDPAYKGADSLALTREVAKIIAAHGYKVGNIDATILCQRPKLAPHIPAMRKNIADAFGLPLDAVSVKATTEEHLGFTGEGLGIAAHAVALIE